MLTEPVTVPLSFFRRLLVPLQQPVQPLRQPVLVLEQVLQQLVLEQVQVPLQVQVVYSSFFSQHIRSEARVLPMLRQSK